ncbi:hypothetical protein O6H91_07G073600 [Diphasiastrum complanatum]|uniref:Uncharacterized protein n=1 Tax=Diphasiastrum complanatum TaxID=34168 RepID=A0ACC2D6K7_DIPCM|nr:hypothetical protein O6H91_07G073600 [Diphasiastrum complanatum]
MDRYQRVEKPRPETSISENEIRITTQGKMRNYITYATSLLQDKGATEVVLKAMGRAINKTVTITEIIKRRIAGLHQITSIGSTDITDLWEPLEEGLLPLETTRHVSMITITLSRKQLDKMSVGYQAPLSADEVKPTPDYEYDAAAETSPQGGRGRARVRGRANRGRGGVVASAGEYNGFDGGWGRGRGRGRFRGRGRGFRGRGRGFGGTDAHQDLGGYDERTNFAERRGRGRGFGGTDAHQDMGGYDERTDFAERRGRGRGFGGTDGHQDMGGYDERADFAERRGPWTWQRKRQRKGPWKPLGWRTKGQ